MNRGLTAAIFAAGAVVGAGAAATVQHLLRTRRAPIALATEYDGQQSLPGAIARAEGAGNHIVLNEQLVLRGEVLKYGNPGPISDLLTRRAYIAAYDRRLRHPAWASDAHHALAVLGSPLGQTAEHLTLAGLGKSTLQPQDDDEKGDRSKSTFKEDESIPAMFRARLSDYFRSGYDRGHMVPAADAKSSQDAMDETFYLSNIAPQVGAGFNRHYWAYVEDWCRRLTSAFADVYVFTIPLYLPQAGQDGKYRVTHEVIGTPPNIAVPTHFAKVVLASRPSSPSNPTITDISAGAFVFPNAPIDDQTPMESFIVPIDAVERAAGLSLVSDSIKANAKHLCKTLGKCELVVRRFDDARSLGKRPPPRRAMSAP